MNLTDTEIENLKAIVSDQHVNQVVLSPESVELILQLIAKLIILQEFELFEKFHLHYCRLRELKQN